VKGSPKGAPASIVVQLTEEQAAEAEREGHGHARRRGNLFTPAKGDRTASFVNSSGADIALRAWLQEEHPGTFVRTSANPNASLTVRDGDKDADIAWLVTGSTKSREFVIVGWLPVSEAKRDIRQHPTWRPVTWLVPQSALRAPGDFGAALFDDREEA
jgi:hypothetical protein